MAGNKVERPSKFTEPLRMKYLAALRRGRGRFAAARDVGVVPETVRRFARASPDFADAILEAEAEAAEPVEDVLYQAALSGEPWAVKEWLTKRSAGRWGEQARKVDVSVEVGGLVGVVAVGAERLGRVEALRRELEERRAVLAEAGGDSGGPPGSPGGPALEIAGE